MHKSFDELKTSIIELTRSIQKESEKSNESKQEIAVIKNEVDNIKDELKDLKTTNTKQHAEFYANDKSQDKFIYKLTGALIFVSFAIGVVLKLVGVLWL